jgi:diaminohydroxyphosphoribosylaminopyrimidine deaminase/5-amino-6-(5-phosphoribosylamino)uracil reductase
MSGDSRLRSAPGLLAVSVPAERSRATAEPAATTAFSDADRAHMARALALAERGLTTASPNPRVGCVIVKNGTLIGEGFHARAGEPHAEATALAEARARGHEPRGSTLDVTLEPCNHHGRTPPCVDAILSAGPARVVAAMLDPNPAVADGAERLRAAGVAVDVGLLEAEARELNIGFVSRMTRNLPWVRMKAAASIDGRTALQSGQSQWITGAEARADGHAWRARACAVLTGVGTILEDDPLLTVRAVSTDRQPLRVIVDRKGDTPVNARVLAGGSVLLVTAGVHGRAWPAGVETLALSDGSGRVDLPGLLRSLAGRGVNELHVEAGARLNGALLRAGLIDELLLYVAPSVLGDPARGMFDFAPPLASLSERVPLTWHAIDRIGSDLRLILRTGRAMSA